MEKLNLIERKSRFTESGQTSNDFFLIGIVDRHAENKPKTNRTGRRKPIKSIYSNPVTGDTPPLSQVTPRTNKQQSVNQKTNNNTLDPQNAAPTIALNGLTERQKEEAQEKLAQLSPEQQSIAIQSFNKAVDGNTAKSPAALMNRLINLGLKNGLETTQTAKPIQTPHQTPKTPAMSDRDYRNARIEVIKALISDPERKERFLNEFKEKGAVYHGAAGGAIMKPDLEAAGLFC